MVCLPEIDLLMPLPPSMTNIVKTKCLPQTYVELTYGKRFKAEEGQALGIIDKAVEPEHLMATALAKAKELQAKDKSREILSKIKYVAYKHVYEACASDSMVVELPRFFW